MQEVYYRITMKCPCHSLKEYAACCAPFHSGTPAPTALLLMRSRYSAFALGLVNYIIETTHPKHTDNQLSLEKRVQQIELFSQSTQFVGLEIMDFFEAPPLATVTFKAILRQSGRNCSFIEKSEFEKLNDRWFYLRPINLENLN